METKDKHLEDLREIRSIMERSSRFISLSGLSGITAGIFALLGAGAAWYYIEHNQAAKAILSYDLFGFVNILNSGSGAKSQFYFFMFTDAALVLILAVASGIYLTTRQAMKKGQKIWDNTSKRMLINLAIPLITGGLFCLILLFHGLIGLIAPAMLIFYGLSLINGSKYTLTDIRYLGFCEIALGLTATLYLGFGLLFWAIGFGVLHIVYGTIMYFKYEK